MRLCAERWPNSSTPGGRHAESLMPLPRKLYDHLVPFFTVQVLRVMISQCLSTQAATQQVVGLLHAVCKGCQWPNWRQAFYKSTAAGPAQA